MIGVTDVIASHPAADIFPALGPREFEALCADIAAHGLREAIWLHPDGRILDGRHRYRACLSAGITPRFQSWDGVGSLTGFVVSLNLHRRHLDESQRAMVAARIANLSVGRPSTTSPIGDIRRDDAPPVSQGDAADMLNVGKRSVERARDVLDHGAPELVRAVETGDVAVSTAALLTTLDPADQAAVVALPADERRDAIRDVREGRVPHVAHNSGNNEWFTPAAYIEAARDVLGAIDLDPASSPIANDVVQATTFYGAEEDGLAQDWSGRVWMNPPYAQPLMAQFADKLAASVARGSVEAAIVLVNNATETQWFRAIADVSSAVCFPTGRVRFWHPERDSASPLQGQAVLYCGADAARFAARFADLGRVWVRA